MVFASTEVQSLITFIIVVFDIMTLYNVKNAPLLIETLFSFTHINIAIILLNSSLVIKSFYLYYFPYWYKNWNGPMMYPSTTLHNTFKR